ncbi:hypothetical protein GPALN_010671 [Globodera pallida]|nr:hypothetical protein GPALN_010671 [Globodera pallida]
MKVFAMLMLRCTLIMLLSSLLHNGTLANLQEWAASCQKLEEWAALCHQVVDISIPHELRTSLTTSGPGHLQMYRAINTFELMLERVNKFPIDGMDELLKHRLQEPLENAISNCKKLEDKVKQSGLENDKKYLESLLSKIRSVAKGIRTELNTFMFEVQLELIKKVDWTSENKNELRNKFSNLCELAQHKESYCNPESFSRAFLWILEIGGPPCQPGTPQFVEYLGMLILNAKLNILKRELSAKLAGFAQQPHIDGDGFMAFSHNFKREWNQIKQQMDQVSHRDIDDIMELYRTELNDLAQTAMERNGFIKKHYHKNAGPIGHKMP